MTTQTVNIFGQCLNPDCVYVLCSHYEANSRDTGCRNCICSRSFHKLVGVWVNGQILDLANVPAAGFRERLALSDEPESYHGLSRSGLRLKRKATFADYEPGSTYKILKAAEDRLHTPAATSAQIAISAEQKSAHLLAPFDGTL